MIMKEIERPRIDISLCCTDSNISPIDKVKIMDEDTFEQFVVEWLYATNNGKYSSIFRIGGAGDKGRDIIAYYKDDSIDYYQCKHYNSPLSPSEFWIEFGKLCYYTYNKEIPMPKSYYIVASNGIEPSLINLLNNHKLINEELIRNWDKHCNGKIIKGFSIELDARLRKYIENFDFGIISAIPIEKVINDHIRTVYGKIRFGGAPVEPPKGINVPSDIDSEEIPYITALYDAYSDKVASQLNSIDDLKKYDLNSHFERQRKFYYSCETIRRFVRDTFTDTNDFERLKQEVYDGIIEVYESDYSDGYERLESVMKQASIVNTTKSLLDSKLKLIGNGERKGTCHMLVNDGLIKWVKKHDKNI